METVNKKYPLFCCLFCVQGFFFFSPCPHYYFQFQLNSVFTIHRDV